MRLHTHTLGHAAAKLRLAAGRPAWGAQHSAAGALPPGAHRSDVTARAERPSAEMALIAARGAARLLGARAPPLSSSACRFMNIST